MTAYRSVSRRDVDRFLRSLCRCDGAKDLAVVAALLVFAASLAIRLARLRSGATIFS